MDTEEANALPVWTDPKGCSGCDHCGMDMDMDPYCAAPEVTKEHPYGLNINQALTKFCNGKLWKKREPR